MSAASPMTTLQKTDFDRLLGWLDPNPERAGELYEKIRWRLIAILAARGCRVPEELADETIDRVARRVRDIEATYVGNKSLYFLGVMNNVHHEYLKRPRLSELAPPHEIQPSKNRPICVWINASRSSRRTRAKSSSNTMPRISAQKLTCGSVSPRRSALVTATCDYVRCGFARSCKPASNNASKCPNPDRQGGCHHAKSFARAAGLL